MANAPQRKLTDGKRHVEEFAWSPDSRAIAFSHQPAPSADDWTRADLSEVDVASGTVKPDRRDQRRGTAAGLFARWQVSGLLRNPSDPPRWATEDRIVLLTRATGEIAHAAGHLRRAAATCSA